ncbi:hypothetical protein [Luteipulveratus flavus]|uniref:Uncharacterized protein n=1 Tax=Luteipulveratus flavus TaxID=3031728 RepID=A0ABT6CAJ6_9MICO|nr:hypothetical protein [Luteipulveratus sp. YIM 133296]MDF8265776.1 hypothetical protein [Luteipulveratus sp. YIM 133296]
MTLPPDAFTGLSVLRLEYDVPARRPDWPNLAIRVDGEDPFVAVAKDWRGFDPSTMLGPASPLLPDDNGRRVALYRCSCGEAGCGVIAPVIVASADRRRVSWVDFRDYVGVFDGPTSQTVERHEGRPWDLPDIHFERDQYLAEVERATSDRSWETPRRQVARLLQQRLEPLRLLLPPDDLGLAGVTPSWLGHGVVVTFELMMHGPGAFHHPLLHLTSSQSEPEHAAEDMAHQLLSVRPDEWADTFGQPPTERT